MFVVVRLDVPEELVEVAPLELLAAEAVAIAGAGVTTMVRADGHEFGRVRLLLVDGAHLLRDSPQTVLLRLPPERQRRRRESLSSWIMFTLTSGSRCCPASSRKIISIVVSSSPFPIICILLYAACCMHLAIQFQVYIGTSSIDRPTGI